MSRVSILSLLLLLMVSCGLDIEKLAAERLEIAKEAFRTEKYSEAKRLIDSVKILYPKAFETRRAAISLMKDVEVAEQRRNIIYLDSVLNVQVKKIEEIKKELIFEKDERYQDIGLYFAPGQSMDENLERTFLRAQVDEKGSFTIVSIFCGKHFIHHRSVKVRVGDNFAQTPISDDCYEYTDLDIRYEKCNFIAGNDGGISAFITLNRNNNVQVTLHGEKTINYAMTSVDKESVALLFSFSQLLSDIENNREQIVEAERKINFLLRERE